MTTTRLETINDIETALEKIKQFEHFHKMVFLPSLRKFDEDQIGVLSRNTRVDSDAAPPTSQTPQKERPHLEMKTADGVSSPQIRNNAYIELCRISNEEFKTLPKGRKKTIVVALTTEDTESLRSCSRDESSKKFMIAIAKIFLAAKESLESSMVPSKDEIVPTPPATPQSAIKLPPATIEYKHGVAQPKNDDMILINNIISLMNQIKEYIPEYTLPGTQLRTEPSIRTYYQTNKPPKIVLETFIEGLEQELNKLKNPSNNSIAPSIPRSSLLTHTIDLGKSSTKHDDTPQLIIDNKASASDPKWPAIAALLKAVTNHVITQGHPTLPQPHPPAQQDQGTTETAHISSTRVVIGKLEAPTPSKQLELRQKTLYQWAQLVCACKPYSELALKITPLTKERIATKDLTQLVFKGTVEEILTRATFSLSSSVQKLNPSDPEFAKKYDTLVNRYETMISTARKKPFTISTAELALAEQIVILEATRRKQLIIAEECRAQLQRKKETHPLAEELTTVCDHIINTIRDSGIRFSVAINPLTGSIINHNEFQKNQQLFQTIINQFESYCQTFYSLDSQPTSQPPSDIKGSPIRELFPLQIAILNQKRIALTDAHELKAELTELHTEASELGDQKQPTNGIPKNWIPTISNGLIHCDDFTDRIETLDMSIIFDKKITLPLLNEQLKILKDECNKFKDKIAKYKIIRKYLNRKKQIIAEIQKIIEELGKTYKQVLACIDNKMTPRDNKDLTLKSDYMIKTYNGIEHCKKFIDNIKSPSTLTDVSGKNEIAELKEALEKLEHGYNNFTRFINPYRVTIQKGRELNQNDLKAIAERAKKRTTPSP